MYSHKSNTRRRLVSLVLVALAPAFALQLYDGWRARQQLLKEAVTQAQHTVQRIGDRQQRIVAQAHVLLETLAELPAIWPEYRSTCGEFLARLRAHYPTFANVAAADKDGNVYCSALPLSGPVNLADGELFQRTQRTRAFASKGYTVGPITGKPNFVLADPLFDKTGEVSGMVYVAIDLAWLQQEAAGDLPAGSVFLIVDREGTIRLRDPDSAALVGRRFPEAPLVKQVLAAKSGTVRLSGLDGVRRLWGFAPLAGDEPDQETFVVAGILDSQVLAGANAALLQHLIGLALVALLAAAATWLLGDRIIVRKIQRLLEATERLGGGDLGARAGHPPGTGDLDHLAVAFNNMAASLQQREAELNTAYTARQVAEARLAGVLDVAPEAIITMDVAQRIVLFNGGAEAMFGYRSTEVLGKPLDMLLPERYHSSHGRKIAEFAAGAEAARRMGERREVIGRRSDGTEFPCEGPVYRLNVGGETTFTVILVDITERKRAEGEVRRQAARAEALVQTGTALNTQLDITGVLQAVTREAARSLSAPMASVWLYDPERAVFDRTASFGLPLGVQQAAASIPRALYDLQVQAMGDVFQIQDPTALAGWPESQAYIEAEMRSIAIAELKRDEQLVGFLDVVSLGIERRFSPDELSLLRGIAHQAAQAISNARLFEQAERRLRYTQALLDIDVAILSSLDLRLTLNAILDEVTRQLGLDGAVVFLLDPHSQRLTYTAGRGIRFPEQWPRELQSGEGLAGRAALERRTICMSDLAMSDLTLPVPVPPEGFVSGYAVPLLSKGQVKGVLSGFSRSQLRPSGEWLQFLEGLASQTAIAIDNGILFTDLKRLNSELVLAYDSTLEGWSHALDLRDKETEGHTQRVTELSVRLAAALGMSPAELDHLRRGALLHDIGKMGIPDSILFKPGPLTAEEWELMRRHPVYAFELLSPIAYLRPALDVPYCHHEKWDGTGYPRGLKGDEIAFAARIFAVVDVWDALRSDRPYRAAWPTEKVREHIRSLSGTHFNPRVIEAFLKMPM